MKRIALALTFCAGAAGAQTMPVEQVRTILDMTKDSWLAISIHAGQDLLYFTQLVTWRCGLDSVAFGVNGAAPDRVFEMPACDPNNPNSVLAEFLPFLAFPENSLTDVTVQVTYSDGATASQSFTRAQIER